MSDFAREFVLAGLGTFGTLLLAVGTIAIRRFSDWLKLASDDRIRAYLQEALELGVEYGVSRVRAYAGAADTPRKAVVREAASYVAARVPDALEKFGIDGDALNAMIEARLPLAVGDGHR